MTKQKNDFGSFKAKNFSLSSPQEKEKKDPVALNQYQIENREMMKSYNQSMENAFDSEFWFTLVFPSEPSLRMFLDKLNIRLSDVGDGEIIDGGLLREHLKKFLKRGKHNG